MAGETYKEASRDDGEMIAQNLDEYPSDLGVSGNVANVTNETGRKAKLAAVPQAIPDNGIGFAGRRAVRRRRMEQDEPVVPGAKKPAPIQGSRQREDALNIALHTLAPQDIDDGGVETALLRHKPAMSAEEAMKVASSVRKFLMLEKQLKALPPGMASAGQKIQLVEDAIKQLESDEIRKGGIEVILEIWKPGLSAARSDALARSIITLLKEGRSPHDILISQAATLTDHAMTSSSAVPGLIRSSARPITSQPTNKHPGADRLATGIVRGKVRKQSRF